MSTENLWYGHCIRNLLNAADELEKAGGQLVQAKDEKLFHEVHEMRMQLWNIVDNLIKNPKDKTS